MNRKQLTILIVLFVVIGGIGLFFSNRDRASWEEGGDGLGQKVLPNFPLNEVSLIRILHTDGDLTLLKDEVWKVKERWNYPANFAQISDFLRKAGELKSVQSPRVGPSQFGRLELVSPDKGTNTVSSSTGTGTLVEFKDQSGKQLNGLLLGKKVVQEAQEASPFGGGGGFPVGRYLVSLENPQKVFLVSEPFNDIQTQPESWLSKDFIKVEKVRAISVSSTNTADAWKVVRDTEAGTWQLAEAQPGEQLDTAKTSGLNYVLSNPTFNDVVAPEATAEATGLGSPMTATLETFDGFSYAIQLGTLTPEDNYHFKVAVAANLVKERAPGADEKPEDKERLDKEFKEKLTKLEEKLKQEKAFERWTYLVPKYTVDALLKPRKDLLAEQKAEANPPPAVQDPALGKDAIPGLPGVGLPGDLPPLPATDLNPPPPAPTPVEPK